MWSVKAFSVGRARESGVGSVFITWEICRHFSDSQKRWCLHKKHTGIWQEGGSAENHSPLVCRNPGRAQIPVWFRFFCLYSKPCFKSPNEMGNSHLSFRLQCSWQVRFEFSIISASPWVQVLRVSCLLFTLLLMESGVSATEQSFMINRNKYGTFQMDIVTAW